MPCGPDGPVIFIHHESAESFCHALQMGCDICKRLCAAFARDEHIEIDKIANWRPFDYLSYSNGRNHISFNYRDYQTALVIQPSTG
jgi:hypothetical protein